METRRTRDRWIAVACWCVGGLALVAIMVYAVRLLAGSARPSATELADGIRRDDVAVIRRELRWNPAFPRTKTAAQRTPLHLVAQIGGPKVAELLVDSGAELNACTDEGKTPLYVAVEWDRVDVAKLLIARGADVNVADKQGFTPLLISVNYAGQGIQSPDLAKALIAAGADVGRATNSGMTALHVAAQNGDAGMVEALLRSGADPNKCDKVGPPMLDAVLGGHWDAAKALAKHGADIDPQSGFEQQTYDKAPAARMRELRQLRAQLRTGK